MTDLKENKMGTMPVFKLIVSMSLPAMFSMIVQALYNIVDSIFVAQYSQDGLTAISLAYPLQLLLISFGVGTGIGINSLVSRRLGEGKQDKANSAATHGILLAVLNWVIFLILGFTVVRPFFSAYTDNPQIMEMGVQYLSCVMIFSFGTFIELVIEKTLQSTGDMIFPMFFMLSGAVTNIVLDPVFIFGFGVIPSYGVLGAAIATVIGQIVSMIFAVIVLVVKKHAVTVSFKNFKFSLSTVKNIYAVGIPSIVMQSIGSVMMLGINAILIGFSNAAVSVFGIYFKLQSFVFMPVFGLTHGVMPVMGYNYGARNRKRLLQALKYGLLIAVGIMALGVLVFWLFPAQLMGMFAADGEMLSIGVTALRTISLCFIPAAAGIMLGTLFQAVGNGVRSLLISVLRQLVVILPAAYLLSFIDLNSVWFAFPIAEVFSLIAAILMFLQLYKSNLSKI